MDTPSESMGNDDVGLSEVDEEIIDLLAQGRETRGSIAEQTGRRAEYLSQRLRALRFKGVIEYHHEPTGIYQLVYDPREESPPEE